MTMFYIISTPSGIGLHWWPKNLNRQELILSQCLRAWLTIRKSTAVKYITQCNSTGSQIP